MPAASALAARRARRDDEGIGRRAVQHRRSSRRVSALAVARALARASRRGAGRSGCGAPGARARAPCRRRPAGGSQRLRLRVAAARAAAPAREQHAREEGLGRERAAERLEHDGELRRGPCPRRRRPRGTGCRPSRARPSPSTASREKPIGSPRVAQLAHARDRRVLGDEVAPRSWRAAPGLRVRTSCMTAHPRSVRKAEHALGDDVELHLGGAALDRVAARAQPLARQRRARRRRSRALPSRGPAGPRSRTDSSVRRLFSSVP